MSWSPKQNSSYHLYLCLEPFVFLFLLFKSKHLIITMASPSSCHDLHLLHYLKCATYLMITWWTRLALRVSSIYQNQTRAFTVYLLLSHWCYWIFLRLVVFSSVGCSLALRVASQSSWRSDQENVGDDKDYKMESAQEEVTPADWTPTDGEIYHYYIYITGVMAAPSIRESY